MKLNEVYLDDGPTVVGERIKLEILLQTGAVNDLEILKVRIDPHVITMSNVLHNFEDITHALEERVATFSKAAHFPIHDDIIEKIFNDDVFKDFKHRVQRAAVRHGERICWKLTFYGPIVHVHVWYW